MTNPAERCPTGIPGLDEMLEGGFPRGRTILLTGSCGTGKTIFATQFLYNGTLKYNEPGVLLTLEQNIFNLKKDMLAFNYDLEKLEDAEKLAIIDGSLTRFGGDIAVNPPKHGESVYLDSRSLMETKKTIDIIIEKAKKINAKRVVVDSLPALDDLIIERQSARTIILAMNYRLQASGLTSILISDIMDDNVISKHGIEEYIVDGVIILKTNDALNTRTLKINKMRNTNHPLNSRIFAFTKEGIAVQSQQQKKT